MLAACSGDAPTTVPDQPSPPADAAFLLRLETEQALPPPARFEWTPPVAITLDRRVLSAGAVDAMFPGPLVAPIVERQLTAAGWARIVAAAREAGLLSGVSAIGEAPAPGGSVVRLRVVADGRMYDITTSNKAAVCFTEPCQGAPGTIEAFRWFGSRLSDLESWLGADIGDEAPHAPTGYAIFVGAVPFDEGLPQPALDWPLVVGFATFGKPFADGSGFRCGTLTGADAATVRPALEAARQTTKWRDPVDGSFHGLTVRPLFPGDGDPCQGLV